MVVTAFIILSFFLASFGFILVILSILLLKKIKLLQYMIRVFGIVFMLPFVLIVFFIIIAMASDHARENKLKGGLFIAEDNGNLSAVKKLTPGNYSINYTNTNYQNHTPLTYAAKVHQFEIVKYLLENHADIHVKNKDRYTALMYAADGKNFSLSLKMVQYLLDFGADINNYEKNADSALHIAVENENVELVKLLLKYQPQINKSGSFGYTPLHIAADRLNTNIVHLLLEYQADVNALDSSHETPFFTLCSWFNHVEADSNLPEMDNIFYSMLKYKPNVNITNDFGIKLIDQFRNEKYKKYKDILIKMGAKQ